MGGDVDGNNVGINEEVERIMTGVDVGAAIGSDTDDVSPSDVGPLLLLFSFTDTTTTTKTTTPTVSKHSQTAMPTRFRDQYAVTGDAIASGTNGGSARSSLLCIELSSADTRTAEMRRSWCVDSVALAVLVV